MNLREQVVECPKCGHHFTTYITRHGAIGSGAHYASQMRLTPTHELILRTLSDVGAVSPETGITLTNFWLKMRQICKDSGRPIPTKAGLSGRLSELQGMGKTKSERQHWFLARSMDMQGPVTLDKVFF